MTAIRVKRLASLAGISVEAFSTLRAAVILEGIRGDAE